MSYALIFLIVAIAAAVLGFGVIAGPLAWLAIFIFVGFTVLTVVSLARGRKPAKSAS